MNQQENASPRETLKDTLQLAREMHKSRRTLHQSLGTIKQAKKVTESNMRELNKKNKIGKKITATGLALVIFPEPIISDIIGTPLILLGAAINHFYSSSTIADIFQEVRSWEAAIEDVSKSLNNRKSI